MKKITWITLSLSTVLFMMNCTTSSPFPSLLYTGGTVHHEDRMTGSQIGPGRIEKRGESCSTGVFLANYVYFGSGNSIQEAMKNGGITKVGVIDHRSVNVLGPLFYRDCVVVWGE